jgi:hypothetical protein
VTDRERAKGILSQVAQEYDELAEDLEGGAGEIRHPGADVGDLSALGRRRSGPRCRERDARGKRWCLSIRWAD